MKVGCRLQFFVAAADSLPAICNLDSLRFYPDFSFRTQSKSYSSRYLHNLQEVYVDRYCRVSTFHA